VSAAGLTLGEGLSPELRSESDTDSSSVTTAIEVSCNQHAMYINVYNSAVALSIHTRIGVKNGSLEIRLYSLIK